MDVKNVQEKITAVARTQSVVKELEEMFKIYKTKHNLGDEAFWGIVDFIDFIKNS